jgi:hypothetical protein
MLSGASIPPSEVVAHIASELVRFTPRADILGLEIGVSLVPKAAVGPVSAWVIPR